MMKSNILIIAKTYPEISRKYTETVCTAGILAETRKLVRLYPIRFRYLEGAQRFKKYQWIKAEIRKALSDPRPESHHIVTDSIEIGDEVPVGKTWDERHSWLISENTVFSSVEALYEAQRNHGTSLGIVKPRRLKRVIIQPRDEKEVYEAIIKKDSVIKQLDLFEEKKDLYILSATWPLTRIPSAFWVFSGRQRSTPDRYHFSPKVERYASPQDHSHRVF